MSVKNLLEKLTGKSTDSYKRGRETNQESSSIDMNTKTPAEYQQEKDIKIVNNESIATPVERTEEESDSYEDKSAFLRMIGFVRYFYEDHPEEVNDTETNNEDK